MLHSRWPAQLQGLIAQGFCPPVVLSKKRHERHLVESHTAGPYVSRLPGYRQALFYECLRSLVVSLEHGYEPQAKQRTGEAPLVSQPAEQRQALLQERR